MIYTNSKIKQSRGPGAECQIPLSSGRECGEAEFCPEEPASGSTTRVQGDSDDCFGTQGRHQSPTPGRLCCGEGLGGESSQAHGSKGQAAGRRQTQRALPRTQPANISSLPFLLSLLLGDTEFWGAGVEQLHTQPAVNGDRKTTQLLRERCPKAHLAG